MLAVTCDDGKLFAVFAKSVKLVGKSCLELLTRNVGELCFGYQGFGFSTDKFLLEHDDLGAVWFLVFELCDLIGDLLLACNTPLVLANPCTILICLTVSRWLHTSLNVANALDGDTVLVVAIDKLVLELTDLVDEHTELVRNIRNIVIACLAPER